MQRDEDRGGSRPKGGKPSSSSSSSKKKSEFLRGGDKEKEGWADDSSTTHCFLTNTKFTVTQRKHHCRYCGQIFITDVCKKTRKIPSEGFSEPVRVCDICYDQLERGDPVCLSRNVAIMRSRDSDRSVADAAKELANWAGMDPQFAQLADACDKLGVPQLLAELLGSSSASTQSAAASLLGSMMTYPELAELLEDANVLSPLVSGLSSRQTDFRVKAANALAAVSSTQMGRAQLRGKGGLGALLEVLVGGGLQSHNSHHIELLEAVCSTLANLCDDDGNDWREIAQAGAVFALAAQLTTSSPSLQESLLTLLALLCAHPECRDQVADAGSMQVTNPTPRTPTHHHEPTTTTDPHHHH